MSLITRHLSLLFLISALASAAGSRTPVKAGGGEFFMVSSVDLKLKQIVLKLPSEVTELAQVMENTVYLDEEGKTLHLKDFRAGDTVYVSFSGGQKGARLIARIRKGPMTLEELHRRYLNFK